jgi:hypothetical protein
MSNNLSNETEKLNNNQYNQNKKILFLQCDNKLYNLNVMESLSIDTRVRECRIINEYADLVEAFNKYKDVPYRKVYSGPN